MPWPKGKPRRVIAPGATGQEIIASPEPERAPEEKAPTIKSVRLASMYGYVTDDGYRRGWPADHVVTDPGEIDELVSRGAPFSEIIHHVD